jgi:hypothetical protein
MSRLQNEREANEVSIKNMESLVSAEKTRLMIVSQQASIILFSVALLYSCFFSFKAHKLTQSRVRKINALSSLLRGRNFFSRLKPSADICTATWWLKGTP